MTSMNITNFRRELFSTLEQTIKYNQPVNVSTKDGNAIILSEEEYNGLIETLAIYSIPGLKDAILEGKSASLSDCIPSDEAEW